MATQTGPIPTPVRTFDQARNWIDQEIVEKDWAPLNLSTFGYKKVDLDRLEDLRRGFQIAKDYILGEYFPPCNWSIGFHDSPFKPKDDVWEKLIRHYCCEMLRDLNALIGANCYVPPNVYYSCCDCECCKRKSEDGKTEGTQQGAKSQTAAKSHAEVKCAVSLEDCLEISCAGRWAALEEFAAGSTAKKVTKQIWNDYLCWVRLWLKIMKRQYVINVLSKCEFREFIVTTDPNDKAKCDCSYGPGEDCTYDSACCSFSNCA